MKKVFFVLLTLLFVTSLLAGDILDIKQFTPESKAEVYDPENLFEYIDGGADIFLSFGFQQLQVRDFAFDSLKFTVELYHMGTPLNAFGIYKSERPQNTAGLKIGAEAVVSPPYQAIMFKGIYYVKINVYEGELDSTIGAQILTAVADVIQGEKKLPPQLNLLPPANKIPKSEGYVREAFLGMSFLKRCLFAEYRLNNSSSFRYFVMLPDAEETADAMWQKLATNWQRTKIDNTEILFGKIPYKGIAAVVKKNDLIYGVADCKTAEQAKELLIRLMELEQKN